MRDAAAMPDLAEEDSALVVHCFHNRLPGFYLLIRPDSGGVRVPVAIFRDTSGFGDEEPARCGPL